MTGEATEPWPYVSSDAHGWPQVQDAAELNKAQLEIRKKRADQEIARTKAQEDAEDAVSLEYYKAILEVAKGSIDRARASAETVQKASAAIVTLYTGVLALAFSVADNPLPSRALFAAVLLGLAVALSTAFLAYLPDPEPDEEEAQPVEIATVGSIGDQLANIFVRWTRRAALQRGRWLRGSVAALAGAVALMPAPFVTFGEKEPDKPKPGWPTVSASAARKPELEKIVYAAQVAEVAEQRKQPLAQDNRPWIWRGAFILALLVTACVIVFPLPSTPEPEPEPAAGAA